MSETTEIVQRPTSITLVCVIGIVVALATVLAVVFSPRIAQGLQMGGWYPPYVVASEIVAVVCFFGLWMMKKWAAYAYLGFVAVNQIALTVMGVWDVMGLIIPGVVVFFVLRNVSKMS